MARPHRWIAFPLEILIKPLIHWIAAPLFTEKPFFSLTSASSHPLPICIDSYTYCYVLRSPYAVERMLSYDFLATGPGLWRIACWHSGMLCGVKRSTQANIYRERAEYCSESTVSEERTHWVRRQTRWVLRKTRWVRFGTQIIGWKELTEFSPRNSVRPKKLTEFGVWNRTLRNRIRPVSEFRALGKLGVVLPHLPSEIFRAIFVNFSHF